MLDVAIVDDEKDVREELAQMVLRFASQEGIRAKTHAYVDGADLLAALDAGEAVHDIVLLERPRGLRVGLAARRAGVSLRGELLRWNGRAGGGRPSRNLQGRPRLPWLWPAKHP